MCDGDLRLLSDTTISALSYKFVYNCVNCLNFDITACHILSKKIKQAVFNIEGLCHFVCVKKLPDFVPA